MTLPVVIFESTIAAWNGAIAMLGRRCVFVKSDGATLPIVCGLAKPFRVEVVQAYGEAARVLTLREVDLAGHVPAIFERVRHDGGEFVIAHVAAVWVNEQRVGYRCIANGLP